MKKTITAVLLLLVAVFTLASCGKDDDGPAPKTFVLVHGAFQGAYAWKYIKPNLEKQGHKVIVVELPAHGDDNTAPTDVSINAYRDNVVSAINTAGGKVVLVGHSMGGMVISAVAEAIPDKIEKLIYIGAFVPANNQSLFELAITDAQSKLGPALEPVSGGLLLDINTGKLADIFCADGSAEVKQLLIDEYRSEPGIPFQDKVAVSAGAFGKVEKHYIFTANDNAVGPDLQHQMVTTAGITKTYTISSSHCPFLSKPGELTGILLGIVQ